MRYILTGAQGTGKSTLLHYFDDKMNVIEPFFYPCRRLCAGDGARMLAVEVGFHFDFDKRLCP